jgi:hypothetical protein
MPAACPALARPMIAVNANKIVTDVHAIGNLADARWGSAGHGSCRCQKASSSQGLDRHNHFHSRGGTLLETDQETALCHHPRVNGGRSEEFRSSSGATRLRLAVSHALRSRQSDVLFNARGRSTQRMPRRDPRLPRGSRFWSSFPCRPRCRHGRRTPSNGKSSRHQRLTVECHYLPTSKPCFTRSSVMRRASRTGWSRSGSPVGGSKVQAVAQSTRFASEHAWQHILRWTFSTPPTTLSDNQTAAFP